MARTFEEEARGGWTKDYTGGIKDDHLVIGCLQRIGTALEAQNKLLETQNTLAEKHIKQLEAQTVTQEKFNEYLRGALTTLSATRAFGRVGG